jgi:hypothetical protein
MAVLSYMHFRAYPGRLVSDQPQAFSLISTQHPAGFCEHVEGRLGRFTAERVVKKLAELGILGQPAAAPTIPRQAG